MKKKKTLINKKVGALLGLPSLKLMMIAFSILILPRKMEVHNLKLLK